MAHTSTVVAAKSVAAKMRAVVITGAQKTEIIEAAIPEPSAHEVRVKIEGCGVSLSNIPLWEGRNWFNYPRDAGAPGREAWGLIDAVGSEVKEFSHGDRVTMLSYHAVAEYDLARAGEVASNAMPKAIVNGFFMFLSIRLRSAHRHLRVCARGFTLEKFVNDHPGCIPTTVGIVVHPTDAVAHVMGDFLCRGRAHVTGRTDRIEVIFSGMPLL